MSYVCKRCLTESPEPAMCSGCGDEMVKITAEYLLVSRKPEPSPTTRHFAIDAEFIDTPTGSHLISFAIVGQNLDGRYWEFDYPSNETTPWLAQNVIPHLNGHCVSFAEAARQMRIFVGSAPAQIWAYVGAYDWYWMCRIFGGFAAKPANFPWRYSELGDYIDYLPVLVSPQHHALNDALSTMMTMHRTKGLIP